MRSTFVQPNFPTIRLSIITIIDARALQGGTYKLLSHSYIYINIASRELRTANFETRIPQHLVFFYYVFPTTYQS